MKKRKFNYIDIILIVVVALMAIGLVYKVTLGQNKKATVEEEYKVMAVTFEVEKVRDVSIDAFEIGANLVDKKTGIILGTITDKRTEPSVEEIVKNDGEIVYAPIPEKFDLYLTIDCPVIEKDTGYFAKGQVDLKRASKMNITSQTVCVESKVFDIEKNDESGVEND